MIDRTDLAIDAAAEQVLHRVEYGEDDWAVVYSSMIDVLAAILDFDGEPAKFQLDRRIAEFTGFEWNHRLALPPPEEGTCPLSTHIP